MKTRICFGILAVVLILAVLPSFSAPLTAPKGFSGARAYTYIEELCKPEYAGRFTGHPGATKAAEWIGARFAEWGLSPAGDDRGWLQFYPMIVSEQLERAHLRLRDGAFGPVTYQEGNDFTVYMNSGSGKVTEEVVFAGFGISEPAMGRDDYAGFDTRGRIVMIQRGVPADEQDWSFANERDYKVRTAAAHGAAALLMLERDDWPIRGGTIHEEGYQPNLPAFNISHKVARDIFHGSFRDLDLILRDLPKKPNSLVLGRILEVQAKMKRIEPGRGENVVALLPGSDPLLRDEYIVIGGHMDHNGLGKDGHLYAGADDNASGTAVVMELARHFAAQPERPKRSLLFVAFGGEEQGLRGSKYFAYHLPVPAGQIAAMLNFDMNGSGDGGASMGGRNYLPRMIHTLTSLWSDSIIAKTRFGRGWGGSGSDHYHFIEQGIPAFYFSSTGGHPFYHQIEDLPRTINAASLQSVGDRASVLLDYLANLEAPLVLGGAVSGRFFIRHGDQFDLEGKELPLAEEELTAAVLAAQDAGIHFTALPLSNPGIPACRLFDRLDSLEQYISARDKRLIRYTGSSTIDLAAGQTKLAVGIHLRGTGALQGDGVILRQLGRLGLNILTIDDPADAVFDGSRLAVQSGAMLRAAESTPLLLHVDLHDTLLVDAIGSAWKGNILWSLDLEQAVKLSDALKRRLAGKKLVVLLRCSPLDDPNQLDALAAALPSDKVHIALQGSTGESDAARDRESFVASLHSMLRERVGGEQAFKMMEKWLGRNLKSLLSQDTRSRF